MMEARFCSRQIMRLIVQLSREQNLASIINIHDVVLAQQFVDRVVGLRAGRVVFDGAPGELTEETLTAIYGDEDWSAEAAGEPEDDSAEDPEKEIATDPLAHGGHP